MRLMFVVYSLFGNAMDDEDVHVCINFGFMFLFRNVDGLFPKMTGGTVVSLRQ